jgi:hypothetical protein
MFLIYSALSTLPPLTPLNPSSGNVANVSTTVVKGIFFCKANAGRSAPCRLFVSGEILNVPFWRTFERFAPEVRQCPINVALTVAS